MTTVTDFVPTSSTATVEISRTFRQAINAVNAGWQQQLEEWDSKEFITKYRTRRARISKLRTRRRDILAQFYRLYDVGHHVAACYYLSGKTRQINVQHEIVDAFATLYRGHKPLARSYLKKRALGMYNYLFGGADIY
jgi:hypothetical protein